MKQFLGRSELNMPGKLRVLRQSQDTEVIATFGSPYYSYFLFTSLRFPYDYCTPALPRPYG